MAPLLVTASIALPKSAGNQGLPQAPDCCSPQHWLASCLCTAVQTGYSNNAELRQPRRNRHCHGCKYAMPGHCASLHHCGASQSWVCGGPAFPQVCLLACCSMACKPTKVPAACLHDPQLLLEADCWDTDE